jgi:hypothetical protein
MKLWCPVMQRTCIGVLCQWWDDHHEACAVQVAAGTVELVLQELRTPKK